MIDLCLRPLLLLQTVTHNGLPQRILPLCLAVKWNCLCSEPCPSVDGRKEEINTSPCLRLAILGDTCKIKWPFNFVSSPHLTSSLIHKRTWHPEPQKDGYFETLFCHLFGQPALHPSDSLAASSVNLDLVTLLGLWSKFTFSKPWGTYSLRF